MILLRIEENSKFCLCYFLQVRRAKLWSLLPWDHVGKYEVNPLDLNPHTLSEYLSQLSQKQLSELWMVYEDDFELFGFDTFHQIGRKRIKFDYREKTSL